MIESLARFVVLILAVRASIFASALPVPNRGKLLFMVIEGRGGDSVVAMDAPSRFVVQEWHRDYPVYDFIYAAARATESGCTVRFTRYVMGEDYSPRQEQLDLAFPYSAQPRYRLFKPRLCYGNLSQLG